MYFVICKLITKQIKNKIILPILSFQKKMFIMSDIYIKIIMAC